MKKFFLMAVIMATMASYAQSVKKELPLTGDDNLILFEEVGKVMEDKSYEVWKVLCKGYALANTKLRNSDLYLGPVVLIYEENRFFYDDEIVTTPDGKNCRQIGVFQYGHEDDRKTVPVIQFIDKKE